MKTTLRRLLCLLLACVMLSSMLPGITAFAAEADRQGFVHYTYENKTVNQTQTVEVPTVNADGWTRLSQDTVTEEEAVRILTEHRISVPSSGSVTEDEYGYITFTTFEDLVELAEKSYDEATTIYYVGEDALTIHSDLTIPHNLDIYFHSGTSELIIPQGVTFRTTSYANEIEVDSLIVDGTFISKGYVYINQKLSVTGSVTLYSDMRIVYDGEVTGEDKVTTVDPMIHLSFQCPARSFMEAADYISTAANHPSRHYCIELLLQEDDTLESDLTFPVNAELRIYGSAAATIANGATLTLNGSPNYFSTNVQVNGKLVNNNQLTMTAYSGQTIAFAKKDAYAGNGIFTVVYPPDASYTNVVLGLDWENFDITEFSGQAQLRNISGLTRLGTPTNLTWNKGIEYTYDNAGNIISDTVCTEYGSIIWKPGSPMDSTDRERFQVIIYKLNAAGEGEVYHRTTWQYTTSYMGDCAYRYIPGISFDIQDSGTYYFTVQALTQEEGYFNSKIAESDTWTYTKPSAQVGNCTNLAWNWPNATWDLPASGSSRTQIEFFYASAEDVAPTSVGSGWGPGDSKPIWDSTVQQYGAGYYYFRVRAVSDDITVKTHGDWSDLSEPYYFNGSIAPQAPVISTSNVASSGKIKISWNAVDGAEKYYIYRSTSKSSGYTYITSTTKTSLTNTSAVAGTTYYYKVKAVSINGDKSEYSNVASRTCDLGRPVVTLSSVASSGKIKLSWEAIDGANKYYIYRRTGSSGEYKYLASTTKTSFINTSAVAGTTYYYKVKAIHSNTNANSANSSAKSRTCDLARPVISTSNVASSGKIKISWDTIDGASKYYIYRASSKDGEYSYLSSTTKTSYINTSAVAGKTYYYKVKAVHSNTNANSVQSTYSGKTCDLARPVVSIALSSRGKPKLTWESIDGAVKYYIYRSTSKDGTYSYLSSTTKTSFTNTGATVGTTYYYKVKAVCSNSAGNSTYSYIRSITAK